MARIRLVHWRASEAQLVNNRLRAAGYQVEYDEQYSSALMRQWRTSPPDFFVIDLSRLPSQGKEIGIAVRNSPKLRHVPLVFCDGAEEKIGSIRALMPDAFYCSPSELISCLQRPASSVRGELAIPVKMMDRYAGRTVAQKLGVKAGATVCVIDPPRKSLDQILGPLPPDVSFREEIRGAQIILNFIQHAAQLRESFSSLHDVPLNGKLWILWCKKGSSAHAGITETLVRETGIALGFVDYKICAIDKDWSAMAFAQPSEKRIAGQRR